MSWLDEADSGRNQAAARAASLFDEEEDFFDLAGELAQELSREPVFQGDEQLIQQEQSLEEIVEGFKRGVAEHLSPTDYDTHFNLGIAYREMELLDEAIGEFQLSAKDPHFLVSCCSTSSITMSPALSSASGWIRTTASCGRGPPATSSPGWTPRWVTGW